MRQVDRFAVGDHGLDGFEVEIGEMDYGFEVGGIIGSELLRAARAIIDRGNLTIEFGCKIVAWPRSSAPLASSRRAS